MAAPYFAPLGEQVEPGTADLRLIEYINDEKFARVLLITGQRSFNWFDEKKLVERISGTAEIFRWSHARPNPEFSNLIHGLQVVSMFNPEVVLGIGGGSVLDTAKLLAALHGKKSSELDNVTSATVELSARNTRLVLVPTTAGSGAEATHFSVLYRDGRKYSIVGGGLLPDCVFLDPHLVVSGEPEQLAASGLDALCQCIESIWAKSATAESQQRAVEGLRAISHSLESFVQGDTSKAKDIQWGSHLSGHAINVTKTTAPHALSYFLTSNFGVPHGIAVASTIGYFIDNHTQVSRLSSSSHDDLSESIRIIRDSLHLNRYSQATEYFQSLFFRLGLGEPRSYWPETSALKAEWIGSADADRLRNHPLPLVAEDLRKILMLT